MLTALPYRADLSKRQHHRQRGNSWARHEACVLGIEVSQALIQRVDEYSCGAHYFRGRQTAFERVLQKVDRVPSALRDRTHTHAPQYRDGMHFR